MGGVASRRCPFPPPPHESLAHRRRRGHPPRRHAAHRPAHVRRSPRAEVGVSRRQGRGRRDPKQALVRELREELAIEAVVGPEIARYEQATRRRSPLLLLFHAVDSYVGEPRGVTFEQIRWNSPQTPGIRFPRRRSRFHTPAGPGSAPPLLLAPGRATPKTTPARPGQTVDER